MRNILARAASRLAPGGLVLLGVAAWIHLDPHAQKLAGIAGGWTYAAATLALLLGWRFQRSRIAAIAIALLMAQALASEPWARGILFQVLSVSLPLTFAAISICPDRPLFSVSGATQHLAVLLQPFGLWLVARARPGMLERLLLEPSATFGGPLGLPAVLAALIGVAVVASVAAVRPREVNLGLFWALGAVIVALNMEPASAAFGLYLATAGLILALSIIEHSHALTYLDDVTGLPTRRPLYRAITAATAPYTFALVRVAGYHAMRAEHGPNVAEQVLRMVSARLRQLGRDASVFRCGAADFAVLIAAPREGTANPVSPAARVAMLPERIAAQRFVVRARNRPRHKPTEPPPAPRKGWVSFHVGVRLGIVEIGERMSRTEVLRAAYESLRDSRRLSIAEIRPWRQPPVANGI